MVEAVLYAQMVAVSSKIIPFVNIYTSPFIWNDLKNENIKIHKTWNENQKSASNKWKRCTSNNSNFVPIPRIITKCGTNSKYFIEITRRWVSARGDHSVSYLSRMVIQCNTQLHFFRWNSCVMTALAVDSMQGTHMPAVTLSGGNSCFRTGRCSNDTTCLSSGIPCDDSNIKCPKTIKNTTNQSSRMTKAWTWSFKQKSAF